MRQLIRKNNPEVTFSLSNSALRQVVLLLIFSKFAKHSSALTMIQLSLRSLEGSHGRQLSGSDDPHTDAPRHLVSHLPTSLPQLKPLWVSGVLHQPRQHYLAHELVLHSVAVPHLRMTSQLSLWVRTIQVQHLSCCDYVDVRQTWCSCALKYSQLLHL